MSLFLSTCMMQDNTALSTSSTNKIMISGLIHNNRELFLSVSNICCLLLGKLTFIIQTTGCIQVSTQKQHFPLL